MGVYKYGGGLDDVCVAVALNEGIQNIRYQSATLTVLQKPV